MINQFALLFHFKCYAAEKKHSQQDYTMIIRHTLSLLAGCARFRADIEWNVAFFSGQEQHLIKVL